MAKQEQDKETLYSIAYIVKNMHFSRVYVHRAFVKGWLKGRKVPMQGYGNTLQWVASQAQIETWRAKAELHNAGHSVFSGTDKQIAQIQDYLHNNDVKECDKQALRASIAGKVVA